MNRRQRKPRPSGSLIKRPSGRVPRDYRAFLEDLKTRIRSAQLRAALAVNRELIQLYWDIGRAIVQKQRVEGWGRSVVERLARDLQNAFPGLEGFSARNIWHARSFFLAYTASEKLKQPVSEIPWGHNLVLLQKLKDTDQRLWYARQAVTHGWSRSMLVHWIESDLYARQGKAITNFKATLPPHQSDLVHQVLKDPYNFDFLTLHAGAQERELEEGLIEHVTRFLLELGAGFAFVGKQVHLKVDGRDFYIDLLFYHLGLRCFFAIDLKTGEFEPEFAGKMNFYLSAVDDRMRQHGDGPSIGLILCRTRSRVIAEYALRHLRRPVGVARYVTKLTETLPSELAGKLPTIKQIEAELAKPLRPGRRVRTSLTQARVQA